MRGVVLCVMLVLVGGCAEAPVETDVDDADDHAGPDGDGAVETWTGHLVANVANATVAPGVPFNVSLEFVRTSGAEANQDAAEHGNGTATDGNATTADGNGTAADGNATGQSSGNATSTDGTDGNATDASTGNDTVPFAAQMPWTVTFSNATGNASYNGTGLPAIFQANLTLLGNVTMTATATWGNTTFTMEPLALVVESLAVDPCQGVAVQDSISRSGILGPGAANNGLATSNNFEVGACQVGLTVRVTTTTGASDIIIRLIGPDGTRDEDANFIGGETLVHAPAGGLVPGAYNAQVRPYAVVADQYQMTITFHERA